MIKEVSLLLQMTRIPEVGITEYQDNNRQRQVQIEIEVA